MAETRKPDKLYATHPKNYGKGSRPCRVTGRNGGMGLIRKYGINMKRQVFRERAIDMGWMKYNQDRNCIKARSDHRESFKANVIVQYIFVFMDHGCVQFIVGGNDKMLFRFSRRVEPPPSTDRRMYGMTLGQVESATDNFFPSLIST